MTKMTWPLAAALALALSGRALAADQIGYANSNADPNTTSVSPQNPLPVTSSSSTSSVTGSITAAAIGASSAQALAAGSRRLLAIDNESTTATIACAFGSSAVINAAGSFTIPPGNTRAWNSYPVPADAVNCIASAASTPATIEAN